MIVRGRETKDRSHIDEIRAAVNVFKLKSFPCTISSPLRKERHPSLSLFSPDGEKVYFKDFGTGDKGRLWSLLARLWHCGCEEARDRLRGVTASLSSSPFSRSPAPAARRVRIDGILVRERGWEEKDEEYWESYGVPLKWLKYAGVRPISHKITVAGKRKALYKADEYAYAFPEFKEGRVTVKIYQPFNVKGRKWCCTHDGSVISLWSKLPEKGKRVCVCSSLKDALCLWANAGVPSVALQGEGYSMSQTAVNELKRRFDAVYVCFDNDEPGLKDAEKLCNETGFRNVVLPAFEGGKDISDWYKSLKDKKEFKTILKLFENGNDDDKRQPLQESERTGAARGDYEEVFQELHAMLEQGSGCCCAGEGGKP